MSSDFGAGWTAEVIIGLVGGAFDGCAVCHHQNTDPMERARVKSYLAQSHGGMPGKSFIVQKVDSDNQLIESLYQVTDRQRIGDALVIRARCATC